LIKLERWIGDREERWPRLRQAFQIAIAASLAYAIAAWSGMPQGFWAVMTAILVTQANVGASLGLAVDRLLGSLLGVIVGGIVAFALAEVEDLKPLGLAGAVFVLGYFSARRPSMRIACVTAAIVILGDPRFGPPISSAWHRMVEVGIGTLVALVTMLIVFPSRAGPAFAKHITRTLPPLFAVLREALTAALGRPLDQAAVAASAASIREAFARGDVLARETQLEVAGFLAEHPDPEAMLRTLRRLWHTEIMLVRALAVPLPAPAVDVLRPQIETLLREVDNVAAHLTDPARHAVPDLSAIERTLDAIERQIEDVRAEGGLRPLSMDDVIRLMAFDFALGQLRLNLRDLAARSQELASFAGTSLPLIRTLQVAFGRGEVDRQRVG
jgi:uncharacterized membrane protein YccC